MKIMMMWEEKKGRGFCKNHHKKTPPSGGVFLCLRVLLYFVHYIRKRFWVLLGKEREDLAVKNDIILLERVNELGVRKAKWAECGIHFYGPKAAEDVLLVLTVCKCVLTCV